MIRHYIIKVSGRVQAVGFRQSTLKEAQDLGLVGTAKNMSDGKVEIHAQGEQQKLNELIEWCKDGPLFAKVSDVEFKEEALKSYDDFKII